MELFKKILCIIAAFFILIICFKLVGIVAGIVLKAVFFALTIAIVIGMAAMIYEFFFD